MDTIKKLSDYAIVKGHSQKFLGVPKTIDNDLALTVTRLDLAARPNISELPQKKLFGCSGPYL